MKLMLDHRNPLKTKTPGPLVEDLSGRSFRDWTVDYFVYAKTGKNSRVNYWMCTCVCGKQKEVSTNTLKYGKTKGCGCKGRTPKDITGEQFGKYIVESFAYKEGGKSYWNVVDDKGNTRVITNTDLHSFRTRSS